MVAAQKMGPPQAPICEAFIMTGETILKTYTNKSENGLGPAKRTVRAADTTTPNLNRATSEEAPTEPQATATETATTTNTTENNNNNNNNSQNLKTELLKQIDCNNSKDYIRHAQYRVAAALEQRGKSLSLNKLSEVGSSNGLTGVFTRSALRPVCQSNGSAGGNDGGDATNKHTEWREPLGREASARVRFPVFLHEQSTQSPQQQQQQQLLAQEMRQQKQKLHERVGGQNSEKSTRRPLSPPLPEADQSNGASKQLKGCEYSITEQVDLLDKKQRAQQQHKYQMDQQQQQQQHPAPVTRTATFIVTSRRDLSKLNGGQRFDDDDFSIEFKTGFLNRKRTFEARGKATSKGQRGWRRVYVILRDLRFIVRYGQEDKEAVSVAVAAAAGAALETVDEDHRADPVAQKLEAQSAKTKKQLAAKDLKNTIRLHHSFAKRSSTYTKREYVFQLYLADQSELLLQANSESEMNSWIDTINFASACLSSPPLPSAVSSSSKQRTYHHHQSGRSRPILPASYTKLSYWEQLTDHEERLERLKTELEEHLNEAPVKRHANKRSKSEFIDKIAYLRQKIEHYTVYLDLMQKKSNSPEAIVLSKHPQIASLTPSKEMVRSLPLNSKAQDEGDKKDGTK